MFGRNKSIRRATRILLIACFYFLLPLISYADPCDVFSDWQKFRAFDLGQSTLATRSQYFANEYKLRKSTADNIFNLYRQSTFDASSIETCLPKAEDSKALASSLSQTFYQRSLEILKSSPLAPIQKLMTLMEQASAQSGLLLFRAAPHFPDQPENDRKAGVYRGTGSIFMNIGKIPASEWLFIFVHELCHEVDPILKNASAIWNSSARAETIFAMAKTTHDPQNLSTTDHTALREYIHAGLDRGLLAEYRAWFICFSIYEAGKSYHLWSQIPWMELVMASKTPQESLETFTFRYLDARFIDPQPEGFFSLSIVQLEYKNMRQELRAAPSKIQKIF